MKSTFFLISFLFVSSFVLSSEQKNITQSFKLKGNWCVGEYWLITRFGTNDGTWQWWLNGELIEGETTRQINLAQYGTGLYRVSFTTESGGASLYDEFDFTTSPGPNARFEAEYVYPAGMVKFATSSPVDTGLKYTWNMGDGTITYVENPVHFYKQEGTYTVTLTITDRSGCSSTQTKQIKWYYPH